MLRPVPCLPRSSPLRFPVVTLLIILLTLAALAGAGAPVHAEKQDARKHYDRATAAFGLGRYADAAVEYEAAFRLRPDPALLYNCAQSYRLAGNKTRAAELYRNYLRLYGEGSNAEDARRHLTDLETEIVAERSVLTTPGATSGAAGDGSAPSTTAAGSRTDAPPAAEVPPPVLAMAAPPPASLPSTVATAAQPPTHTPAEEKPLLRRPWFWAAVGVALIGGTVAILLATKSDKDPTATFGSFPAN